ncbi:MAG: phosphoribosylformylglycinamidine cyclo-ligase, partial [Pseudomonadales bacterium]|nr:phosphoribosylformylglycinamidine cyclo-ligase [Pseudomonadales bacterium]
DMATEVVKGIGKGCELAGCALVGGETAEMPGMYQGEEYDLAGFSVGVVEKSRIIDQSSVVIGDKLIGIDSSGPHSNGYSLIRKILQRSGAKLDDPFGSSSLGETLLCPTVIYVKAVQALLAKIDIHGIAHITGGGITENLPRVLPEHALAKIDTGSWQRPDIFNWLQQQGNVLDSEMYRTFNCGIGMVLCVDSAEVNVALDTLSQQGLGARVIGEITEQQAGSEPVLLT